MNVKIHGYTSYDGLANIFKPFVLDSAPLKASNLAGRNGAALYVYRPYPNFLGSDRTGSPQRRSVPLSRRGTTS
ncbi:hypothetical protein BN874_520009 [Candidatus Contendobacter odensis Run_B_J11]|uniref:Uncharacterized protein n=1 Tax=Candidatus Contendobacter odensis Run_B_J11 TaxID=1400861 RepID=A0A7U7J5K9_9GAMM|nr:hypothetical protein BN874_520009 [Candidatus Contendobacter odensis Run_B_J11]